MTHVRLPAVADRFYPSDPRRLETLVKDQLALARERALPGRRSPAVVVMPHAGYVYSGPVAASAAAPLAELHGSVRRVVVLGPSHHVPLRGIALPEETSFRTPLGDVTLDVRTLGDLGGRPGVRVEGRAHASEHSIEVELPFLQILLGEFLLVPLLVGDSEPGSVAELLDELATAADTLIVVSTDLSHFLPYDEARLKDSRTADAVERLEEDRIAWDDACGRDSLRAALVLARQRGWKVTTVDLRNSGDTAGDRRSVVGYGAWHIGLPENGSASAPVSGES